mgnify:CR=1 FL=1
MFLSSTILAFSISPYCEKYFSIVLCKVWPSIPPTKSLRSADMKIKKTLVYFVTYIHKLVDKGMNASYTRLVVGFLVGADILEVL